MESVIISYFCTLGLQGTIIFHGDNKAPPRTLTPKSGVLTLNPKIEANALFSHINTVTHACIRNHPRHVSDACIPMPFRCISDRANQHLEKDPIILMFLFQHAPLMLAWDRVNSVVITCLRKCLILKVLLAFPHEKMLLAFPYESLMGPSTSMGPIGIYELKIKNCYA